MIRIVYPNGPAWLGLGAKVPVPRGLLQIVQGRAEDAVWGEMRLGERRDWRLFFCVLSFDSSGVFVFSFFLVCEGFSNVFGVFFFGLACCGFSVGLRRLKKEMACMREGMKGFQDFLVDFAG